MERLGRKLQLTMLSSEELARYNRHIILPEVGKTGQERLRNARVLVIGAGGLGCPVLLYLTAAGVGTLGIIDFDVVDASNLHRQVLFGPKDVGREKAAVAAEVLSAQNPFVRFVAHNLKLTRENALELLSAYDVVVDGSDNFPTRYLVNDACVILKKPLVFGSIFKFEGQVSIFNLKNERGEYGPTYRCLFPEPPNPKDVPNCNEIGVLGVLPGMIGSIQANETLKIILRIGEPLSGKLLVMDALTMATSTIAFSKNEEESKIVELAEDYEEFCHITEETQNFEPGFKEISVYELRQKLDSNENIELLDVREEYETEICSLGGISIPMHSVPAQVERIPTDKPLIVYCHHGMRSAMIVKFLSEELGFANLYNLDGGIHAWATHIDKTMARY